MKPVHLLIPFALFLSGAQDQDELLKRARDLLGEAESVVPVGEKDVAAQREKAGKALEVLKKADEKNPEVWIERSRARRITGDWSDAKKALDRAVALERTPGRARYERGLLPFRYMLHAMPYLNPSAAGALTERKDVWSLRIGISRSLKYGWIFADPIGFKDTNDPLITAAAEDFSALKKDPERISEVLIGEAVIAYLKRQPARTDYFLRQALKRSPDDPELLLVAGLNAVRVAEYHPALEYLDRAIEKRGTAPFAFLVRGALRLIVREDLAGAYEDLRRLAPWLESEWFKIIEPVASLRALALKGRWDNEEFREAMTRTSDVLMKSFVPPRRSVGGWLLPLLLPTYESLKDPDFQDATIELATALSKISPSEAEKVHKEVNALLDALIAGPWGDTGPGFKEFAEGLKDPDLQKRILGLTMAVVPLFKGGTLDQKIARWTTFQTRLKEDFPPLFKDFSARTRSNVGMFVAGVDMFCDLRVSMLHGRQGDRKRQRERLEAVLKTTEETLLFQAILAMKGKGSHNLGAGMLRAVRALVNWQLGEREIAVLEIKQWMPVAGDDWGEIAVAGWEVLRLARSGKWDTPEFLKQLSRFAKAFPEEGPGPRKFFVALKDPAVQQKSVALVTTLSRADATDKEVGTAVTDFIDVVTDTPWGEDRLLEAYADPVLLEKGIPLLRAWTSVALEKDKAKKVEQWEVFKTLWTKNRPALEERWKELKPMKRIEWRYRNYIPVALEFVPPMIDWIQAGLLKELGKKGEQRERLRAILKWCDDNAERLADELREETELPEELFTAFRIIVTREMGDFKLARAELERFVAFIEERDGTAVFELMGILRERFPQAVPLLRMFLNHACVIAEEIDLDIAKRWAALVEPFGIDRTREIFVKRVQRKIEERDFDGALKLIGDKEPALKVDVFVAQGRIDAALKLCGDLLRADPWDDRVARQEVRLLLDRKRGADAAAVLAELIDHDRFNARALHQRATILIELGRTTEARIDAERFLYLKPHDRNAWPLLREIHKASARPRQAIQELTRALKEEPLSPWLHAVRGEAHLKANDSNQAKRDLNRAIELSPGYAHAHLLRGRARAADADPKGAVEDFTRTLMLAPSYVDARFDRAKAHLKMGHKSQARRDLTAILRREPKGPRAEEARALFKQLVEKEKR